MIHKGQRIDNVRNSSDKSCSRSLGELCGVMEEKVSLIHESLEVKAITFRYHNNLESVTRKLCVGGKSFWKTELA